MSRNGTRRGTPPTGAPTTVPGTTRSGRRRLLASVLAGMLLVTAPVVTPAAASAAPVSDPVAAAARVAMLAGLSATMTASSYTDVYAAGNAGDGNADTYWESANNAFPQWIQVDLGATVSVDRVVLKLPPAPPGRPAPQTLSVRAAPTARPSPPSRRPPATPSTRPRGNTVTVDFTAASTRYVRLHFTGNTGWPAGQLSELEVYGPASGDTQAPSAPGNLAYTQPASGQIRLTWIGVDRQRRRHRLRRLRQRRAARPASPATSLTYTDSQPDSATVSYYVRAKDAAGNAVGEQQHGHPHRHRQPADRHQPGGRQADHRVRRRSSRSWPTNANDNNVATYWEGSGLPGAR